MQVNILFKKFSQDILWFYNFISADEMKILRSSGVSEVVQKIHK